MVRFDFFLFLASFVSSLFFFFFFPLFRRQWGFLRKEGARRPNEHGRLILMGSMAGSLLLSFKVQEETPAFFPPLCLAFSPLEGEKV